MREIMLIRHHFITTNVTNKEMRQCDVNNADADLRERSEGEKWDRGTDGAAAAAAAVHSLTR